MRKDCTNDRKPPLVKTFQRRVKEPFAPDRGTPYANDGTKPLSLNPSNGGDSLSERARACEESPILQEVVSSKAATTGCPCGLLKSLRNRRTSVILPFALLMETCQHRKKSRTQREHLAAVKALLAELVAHFAEVDAFELVVEDAKPSPKLARGHRDRSKSKSRQSGSSIHNLACKTREHTYTRTPVVDVGVNSATPAITPAATARTSLGMQPHAATGTIGGKTVPQNSARLERLDARSSPAGIQEIAYNGNSPPLHLDYSVDLRASLDSRPSPDFDLHASLNPDQDAVYDLAQSVCRMGIGDRRAEASGSASCRAEPCAFGVYSADRLVGHWQSNDTLSQWQLPHLRRDLQEENLSSREGPEMVGGQETCGEPCETAVVDALPMPPSCSFSGSGTGAFSNSGGHSSPSFFISGPREHPDGVEDGADKTSQPLPVADAVEPTGRERRLHQRKSFCVTQVVDGVAAMYEDQQAQLLEGDYVNFDHEEMQEGEEDRVPEEAKALSEEDDNGVQEVVQLQEECDKDGHDVEEAQGNQPQRKAEERQEAIGMSEDTVSIDMEVVVVVAGKEADLAIGVCAAFGEPSAQAATTAHEAQQQNEQQEEHHPPLPLTSSERISGAKGQDDWGKKTWSPVESAPTRVQRDEGEEMPVLSTISTASDSRSGDVPPPAILEMPITLLAAVARSPCTAPVTADCRTSTVDGIVEHKEEERIDLGLVSEPEGLDIRASIPTNHADTPLDNVAGLQVFQGLSEAPALTPLQQLLKLCGQKPLLELHELPTIDDIINGLLADTSVSTGKGAKGRVRKVCTSAAAVKRPPIVKVGEGSYGEAWRLGCNRGGGSGGCGGTRCDVVMKVVPIEGNVTFNEAQQKTAAEVMSETLMSSALSNLVSGPPPGLTQIASAGVATCNGGGDEPQHANCSAGFVRMHSVAVCRGPYSRDLVEAWIRWDKQHGSENEPVSHLPPDQLYWIIAMEDSGTDLEKYVIESWDQLRSVLLQIAVSLAVAEAELSFEHRDLHWGNVLIRRAEGRPDCAPGGWLGARLRGRTLRVSSCGVATTIIDFTNSRLVAPDGLLVFCDLSRDPGIFEGTKGDVQFDTYRWMRSLVDDDWSSSCPATNCLWVSYLAEVLCKRFGGSVNGGGGKSVRLNAAQKRQLREFRKRSVGYGSCGELVWDELFQGLLQADD